MTDPHDSTDAKPNLDSAENVAPEAAESVAPLDPVEQLQAELAAAQAQLAEQRDQA